MPRWIKHFLKSLKLCAPVLAIALIDGTSFADESCDKLMRVVDAAQNEFKDFVGEKMDIEVPEGIEVFKGRFQLTPEGICTVAIQSKDKRGYSTGYTCRFPADDAAKESLKAKIQNCLKIENWYEQPVSNSAPMLVTAYGLLRVSMSQHKSGTGLGIEVFRDKNGNIAGSSIRGNRELPDGRQYCTPKSYGELKRLYEKYASRPGAEPFDNDQFYGVTNKSSATIAAFMTKPIHPAHPALMTRGILERDDGVFMTANGDFAGDCLAFHDLLAQVRKMNEGLKQP